MRYLLLVPFMLLSRCPFAQNLCTLERGSVIGLLDGKEVYINEKYDEFDLVHVSYKENSERGYTYEIHGALGCKGDTILPVEFYNISFERYSYRPFVKVTGYGRGRKKVARFRLKVSLKDSTNEIFNFQNVNSVRFISKDLGYICLVSESGINYALFSSKKGLISDYMYENLCGNVLTHNGKRFFFEISSDGELSLSNEEKNISQRYEGYGMYYDGDFSETSWNPYYLKLKKNVLALYSGKRKVVDSVDWASPILDVELKKMRNVLVRRDNKLGLYAPYGREIVPCELDTIFELYAGYGFGSGYTAATSDAFWVFYGAEGADYRFENLELVSEVISQKYKVLWSLKMAGMWGVMNEKGETVVPFEFDTPFEFFKGANYDFKDVLVTRKVGKYGLYHLGEGEVLTNDYEHVAAENGALVVIRDGLSYVLNDNFEPVSSHRFDGRTIDGYFYNNNENGRLYFAYIDGGMSKVCPFEVEDFHGGGSYLFLKLNGKWGAYSYERQEWLFEPEFDEIGCFTSQPYLFWVRKGDRYAFVAENGRNFTGFSITDRDLIFGHRKKYTNNGIDMLFTGKSFQDGKYYILGVGYEQEELMRTPINE